MSFVVARPEAPATQNIAGAAATTGLGPAAADLVSALTATQFSTHAVVCQAAGAQAMAIHELMTALFASGGSYASNEAANAAAAS